ncbi:DegT/DnrJ/EryC1/StrS family aminotransferase [Limisalsivibrio acetivorans]|uniref:DegT/DnrJ/EryC1/StrS family aminotransferase n=1 Tax=Limisalsivibrio acetivorans TaxID=1304888 RepID=UPI0003B6CBDB|nr:DegT/DnrJ/EryC1/StrS family aminotransferase [Limisalsivibrio acetivorans]
MEVRFFDYPKQFGIDAENYERIIMETLRKGAYILGAELESFERNLAEYVGVKHAVGVNNCTDAILISLLAAGVGPGDEVITVSHTFVATVEVIKFTGAEPVLVDIGEDRCMDVSKVEEAITPKTKAIVPVQLNGRIMKGMDNLMEIAEKHGLSVIEDSSQAIGAELNGKGAGSIGLTGNFSFYPAKVLGAFGDAGAITTDDDEIAEKAKLLRNHGRAPSGEIVMWGLNSRLDNVHAAILDYKLTRLDENIEKRRVLAKIYHDKLKGIEQLVLPAYDGDGHRDVFQNYEIEAENRETLEKYLADKGIQTPRQWGGKGVHQFEKLGFDVSLPRTELFFSRCLLLPLYPELETEKAEYVADTIAGFYA